MAKKTVIKVNINCEKCKRDLLKAVTKLTGIDQISLDGGKETLTVVGDVDPVFVVEKLRKIRKFAEIVTVGPPKNPEPDKPKPETKKKTPDRPLPSCCKDCKYIAVAFDFPYDNGICSIL